MNRYLKRCMEKGLRGAGIAAAVRAAGRGDVVVLAYHNIVPDGAAVTGDLSLHLPQREFARQLDWLRSTHDVVPLSAIFETPRSLARPRAVVTFDDAYRGAVTAGVKELSDRDLPGTVFVAPAFVGGGAFWWDLLAAGGGAGLASEVRNHCLEALDGRNDRVLTWAGQRQVHMSDLPLHQRVATEDELVKCAVYGGITFASHTWSHSNLCRISAPELREELERPLAWLRERFSQVSSWLAYPYGLATRTTAAAARAAGYEGAFLVHGGRTTHRNLDANRYTMPRLNIPAALSLDAFALRASGLSRRWSKRLG